MNTSTKPGAIDAARDRTAAAISALEGVPLGEKWAPADAEASRALAEVLALSRAALIPSEIRPVDQDVIRHFEFLLEGVTLAEYVEHLADIHARSVNGYPEMAEFIRSAGVLARVRRVAASLAPRMSRASDDVEREHEQRFFRLLAGQLQGVSEYEPAASVLAVDVPAMETRLNAARHRHEEHARAEMERLEAERVAADEALAAADRERRSALAAFFSARGSRTFYLHGRTYSGAGIASIVSGEAARDVVHLEFGSAPLDAIRLLMDQTEAAEAVAKQAR